MLLCQCENGFDLLSARFVIKAK